MKTKPRAFVCAKDVEVALSKRFCAPQYAFLPQCRNGTGFARSRTRTADALALSLWPSRGLDLHGFEIKISRSDWKAELKNPEKAEDIQQYCDRWWIVISDASIVEAGELPPTWGLMVFRESGMHVLTEAPKLASQPIDKALLCSILRKAGECTVPLSQVDERIAAGEAKLKSSCEAAADLKLHTLQGIVTQFEAAAGVAMNGDWWRAKEVGQAVKFVLESGADGAKKAARELLKKAEGIVEQLKNLDISPP